MNSRINYTDNSHTRRDRRTNGKNLIKSDGTLHFTGTRKATTKISSHYQFLSMEKEFKIYVETGNKCT